MVATPIVLVLVPGNAVVEGHFARQAATDEQLERPINGGDPDLRVALFHQTVQLLRGKVFPGLQEGFKDRVPLLGMFQSDPLQMRMKDLLSVAQRFARDGSMIVNTFRQHGIAPGG